MKEYWMLNEKYDEGKITTGKLPVSEDLTAPQRLEWNFDGLEEDIAAATQYHQNRIDAVDVYLGHPKVCKADIKKLRVSPDGFVQMALQLSYNRLYKCFPKTYEPATGRMYALGRTETVHPASEWSVKWVKAMEGDGTDKKTTIDYLKKAIKVQTDSRLESTIGRGCDRHLLSLLCASRELGMDLPAMFIDKAWRKGFQLSTSQTPNKICELDCPVDVQYCSGGFGPGAQDGYGVSYVFFADDLMNVAVTSWHTCEDTNSKHFFDTLNVAMRDIEKLLKN